MDSKAHWEEIYRTKFPGETSWFQPHLQTSLEWIARAVPDRSASIIDVGGGESTLVDDLLASGYGDVMVLDISDAAIRRSQERLRAAAQNVHWLIGDITQVPLPAQRYDLWHDRAAFHFFTDPEQRSAYFDKLASALKRGGQVVMATFGPDGPEQCSGIATRRYDAALLQQELGSEFCLVRSGLVDHRTPFGARQQFLYCHFTFSSKRAS